MTWAEHHADSERLASAANEASRKGDFASAQDLYRAAAKAERAAFDGLETSKNRTRGITAVSAVSLSYKEKTTRTRKRLRIAASQTQGFPRLLSHKFKTFFRQCGANRPSPPQESNSPSRMCLFQFAAAKS